MKPTNCKLRSILNEGNSENSFNYKNIIRNTTRSERKKINLFDRGILTTS